MQEIRMPTLIQVLLIEDSDYDAELILSHLRKAGFEPALERVTSADQMQAALQATHWDVIISDFNLPAFSAPEALALLQKSGQEIPFIVISGTISEETALDLLRDGAADYLMKDRLARLGSLVRRELRFARALQERWDAQLETEQRYKESQTWANLVYNHSSDAMFLLAVEADDCYRCVSVNVAYLQSTGMPEEGLIGKRMDELTTAPVARFLRGKYQEAIRLGQPIHYEETGEAPSGRYWVETTLSPICNSAGRVTHLLGCSRDISRHKQVSADLGKWGNIIEHAGWGIAVGTPDGKNFELVNPVFAQMHGCTEAEILQIPVLETFAPSCRELVPEYIRLVNERGQYSWESKHLRKDGTTFPVLIDATAVKDEAGQVKYRIVYVQDISERKRIENALAKRVVALTQPLDDSAQIAFTDLFNLEEIQQLQDEFALATGVASIITNPEGTPITQPSSFCHLCSDIIRKTEKGQANCFRSDAALGRISAEGPAIQPCMSGGLWDAGAGISVGGHPIANWLIGQVRDETQTEEQMRRYAQDIGADEAQMLAAFREVPAMTPEKFQRVAQVLYTLANQLSTMAYQNVQQARFISEQKRVETLLRDSEGKFRSIAENSFDMIALFDLDGNFVYCNRSYSSTLGYDPQELVGRSGFEIVHPEDLPEVLRTYQHILENNIWQVTRLLLRIRCADGRFLWVENNFSFILDEQGRPMQIMLNAQDISERKRTEDALRRSEEKFATAFRISPDSININRLVDGLYIDVNEGFSAMTGYLPEDVIGKTSIEIDIWVNPADRQRLIRELKEKGVVINLEAPFRTKNGQIIVGLMSARTIEFNGEVCLLSITRDFNDRKQAEERSNQLNAELEKRVRTRTEQLEAANKELEAFSYSVSHDLRAPLRSLDGFSEILLDEYADRLDEQGKDYLLRIQHASKRMGNLISDLLNLSRVTRTELVRQEVDLSAIAREIAHQLRWQDLGRAVEFSIADDLVVDGDVSLMRIVLENLLSNAYKFTSKTPNACIQFGLVEEEGERMYFVRDNGAGFDMLYADKLFIPFQRLHGTADYPGTGIGLVLVQRIISRHGGRIWPEARVGSGATFYFTIASA
jgi:two-component system, cell cycle sensor histidine kinase and response regulator CckA